MDGQNVINEIAFSQSVINIGSDSGNDIVLRGAKVADFHAMLNYAGSFDLLIRIIGVVIILFGAMDIAKALCLIKND